MSYCFSSLGPAIWTTLPPSPNLAIKHKSFASLKHNVQPWDSKYSLCGSNVVASHIITRCAFKFLIICKKQIVALWSVVRIQVRFVLLVVDLIRVNKLGTFQFCPRLQFPRFQNKVVKDLELVPRDSGFLSIFSPLKNNSVMSEIKSSYAYSSFPEFATMSLNLIFLSSHRAFAASALCCW